MRFLIVAVALCLVSEPASACPVDMERAYFAPKPGWSKRHEVGPLPSRPSFYGYVGGSAPVFTRPDGTKLSYAGPFPVEHSALERIDVEIESGDMVLTHNGRQQNYVVDPNFVPRTRSVRFESEAIGDWLSIESDAVMLRVERSNGKIEIVLEAEMVLLEPTKARIFAIHGDRREELIFDRSAQAGLPSFAVEPPPAHNVVPRWPLVVLALVALCAVVLGRLFAPRSSS